MWRWLTADTQQPRWLMLMVWTSAAVWSFAGILVFVEALS